MPIGNLLGRGNTAEVYAFGEDRILKLYYKSMPSSMADLEFRIAKTVEVAGIATPAIFERVEHDGRVGLVYERVDGDTMTKRMVGRVWQLKRESRMMAHLHRDMHATTADFLPSQKQQVADNIRAAKPLLPEQKTLLLETLSALPDGDRLCHGDYHPDNVLYSRRGPVIIDWLTATCGNPLADVASTCLVLRHAALPKGMPALAKWGISRLRGLICSQYLQEYTRLTGASLADITAWETVLAAARLTEPIPAEEKSRLLSLIERNLQASI